MSWFGRGTANPTVEGPHMFINRSRKIAIEIIAQMCMCVCWGGRGFSDKVTSLLNYLADVAVSSQSPADVNEGNDCWNSATS